MVMYRLVLELKKFVGKQQYKCVGFGGINKK
jgi:hypothetical protein